MSSEGPSLPSGTAPAPLSARDAGAPRRWGRPGLPLLLVLALLSIAAGWLTYAYLGDALPAPDTEDTLALSIIGGWWNVAGDRHLVLEWEGRRATLRDYSKSDDGVESLGTWRTTKDTVIVDVRGLGGELMQTLELVGNDAEMFLAPSPARAARLMDSWIADHDDDDDEDLPADSTAQEV